MLGTSEVSKLRDHRALLENDRLIGHLSWKYLYIQDYRHTNKAYLEMHPTLGKQLVEALGLPVSSYEKYLQKERVN